MTHERLTYLLKKYKAGNCSTAEQEELDDFYVALDKEEFSELPAPILEHEDQYTAERFAKLRQLIDKQEERERRSSKALWYKIAATVLVITVVSIVMRQQFNKTSLGDNPALVSFNTGTEANNRFLPLQDSSVVILRSGSELQVDTTDFGKVGRTVMLKGEGYFDIHHDPEKPFMIKVGDINVTVLGTAFNIKESGDSIAVSVTRGKVSVSKGGKEIALLSANQELIYAKQEVQQTVQEGAVTGWVKEDLQFTGQSLEAISVMLEKRYGVAVSLDNEKLKACKISAADAFSGTETIDEVLDFICTIVNASYTKEGNTIKIHGEGCVE